MQQKCILVLKIFAWTHITIGKTAWWFPNQVLIMIIIILSVTLVGFGRACAPVRCAHPSFWAHCQAQEGAARPPPIAASLLPQNKK
jgi:hypothetical protein